MSAPVPDPDDGYGGGSARTREPMGIRSTHEEARSRPRHCSEPSAYSAEGIFTASVNMSTRPDPAADAARYHQELSKEFVRPYGRKPGVSEELGHVPCHVPGCNEPVVSHAARQRQTSGFDGERHPPGELHSPVQPVDDNGAGAASWRKATARMRPKESHVAVLHHDRTGEVHAAEWRPRSVLAEDVAPGPVGGSSGLVPGATASLPAQDQPSGRTSTRRS